MKNYILRFIHSICKYCANKLRSSEYIIIIIIIIYFASPCKWWTVIAMPLFAKLPNWWAEESMRRGRLSLVRVGLPFDNNKIYWFTTCFNRVFHSLCKVGRNGNFVFKGFNNSKKKLPPVGLDLVQEIIAGLGVQCLTISAKLACAI